MALVNFFDVDNGGEARKFAMKHKFFGGAEEFFTYALFGARCVDLFVPQDAGNSKFVIF